MLSASGGSIYSWVASPVDTTLKTPSISNPTVQPSVTTQYTVTSPGLNLLTNSSFESGNTGFITDYNYVTGSTYTAQSYSVQVNPNNQNSYFTSCGDHTTGTGKMMVVDGGLSVTARIWSQTITVIPNANYTFSYWIQDLSQNPDSHPAYIKTLINGSSIGAIAESPLVGLPCGQWAQKLYVWNSGANTTAQIAMYDTTTFAAGNDFALDDISFGATCTYSKTVTITATHCFFPLSIKATHVNIGCNMPTGSITVTPFNGTAPYTYSINGGAFGSNNIFSGLSSGSYKVAVRDATLPLNAEIDTTIIINAAPTITVSNDTTICAGSMVHLFAQNGSNFTWVSSPSDTSTVQVDSAHITAKPATTTVYTVTSSTAPTNNLIVNPAFDNGNSGFSSQYNFVTSSTFNAGSYSVQTNPSNQNSFFSTCGDHTTGTGNMLVVDGATDGLSKIWRETITVTPNTDYTFSYWIQDLSNSPTGDSHPAALNTLINNISIGPIGASPVYGLPCGGWIKKTYTWNSGINTTAQIAINDTTTFPNGNDFALDDMYFGSTGCTLSKNITVTVIPSPIVNAGNDTTISPGQSVLLTGTSNVTNPTYLWTPSSSPSSTTLVSPTITTPYTLQVTDNNNGCSASDEVVVSILSPIDECLTIIHLFTPNKDGHNDLWKVYSGNCYEKVVVSVYNRWGGLVYHSDNYVNDWDGTYKGNPVPDATYYYVIMATKTNGPTVEQTGNVSIIR